MQAWSPNTNNVVQGRNSFTGLTKSYFEDGALFIATVRYDDVVLKTSDCLSGDFEHEDSTPSYGNSCPGSIVILDICSGDYNYFVNNLVDGPVYGMVADNNMNLFTQNGQGGSSVFSVPFTPGIEQSGVFMQNQVSSTMT